MSNIADKLTALVSAKNDMKTALESKGVTPTGGLSTYADAIQLIEQQNITINGSVDYTQIGWSQDVSNEQNKIDNAVLHNHLEYSKEIMQHYQKGFSKDDSWKNEYRFNVVYMPNVDTYNVTDMSVLFGGYSGQNGNVPVLRVFPTLNTQNVTDMTQMFQYCTSLESVGLLNCFYVRSVNKMFMYCHNLMHLEGFSKLGYALTSKSSGLDNTLDLSDCEKLTKQSVINVFNTIYDNSGNVDNQYKNHMIRLSNKTLSLLSNDEIAIATNKGWTIS